MSAAPKRKPRDVIVHEPSDFAKRKVESALNNQGAVGELLEWIGHLEHAAFVAPIRNQSRIVQNATDQGFKGGFVGGWKARAWREITKMHPDMPIAEQAVLVDAEGDEARVVAERMPR